jgi:DNA-binding CsgD family transcriptional regulator/5-methylcytosine-specific restriction endonuclease McrA
MFVSETRAMILSLRDQGVAPAEIARRLDLAPTTVDYHLARAQVAYEAGIEVPPLVSAVKHSATGRRAEIARLLATGLTKVEIAHALGLAKSTVSYHAARLGVPVDDRAARRYDWQTVQRYYDDGHSVRECMEAFGFSSSSWSHAVRRGAVIPRPSATPMSDLLARGVYRGRSNLKWRLIKEGLKQNRCERCGLTAWLGEPLTMALHHINGDRLDNRLENLELLCPNCHSQTETFAGRNGRRPTSPPELLSA